MGMTKKCFTLNIKTPTKHSSHYVYYYPDDEYLLDPEDGYDLQQIQSIHTQQNWTWYDELRLAAVQSATQKNSDKHQTQSSTTLTQHYFSGFPSWKSEIH